MHFIVGAEKLLGVMAKMQSKIDRLEEELVRVKSNFQSELAAVIDDLKGEIRQVNSEMSQVNARLARCETSSLEYQQKIQNSVDAGILDIEKLIDDKKKTSWSDIVAKEVDSKLKSVTTDMASLHTQTKAILQDRDEQAEINKRRTGVMIHGLFEPSGNIEEGKKEDSDNITELLHALGCDEVSVSGFTRLGRRPEGAEAKPRPVKMVLASEAHKDKVLCNAKNLKNSSRENFRDLYLHQDLTPKQQEARHKLVLEMKKRRSDGEKDLILVNGGIIKRRGYIPAIEASEVESNMLTVVYN